MIVIVSNPKSFQKTEGGGWTNSGSLDVFGPKILTPSDEFVQTLVTFFSAKGEAKVDSTFWNFCQSLCRTRVTTLPILGVSNNANRW